MACNYCGRSWRQEVSSIELKEEVERRKALARKARGAYISKVWPTYGRAISLLIIDLFVVIFGELIVIDGFMKWDLGPRLAESAWRLPFFILLLIGVTCVLASPIIYFARKADRRCKDFNKAYPEHAEWL